MNAAQRERPRPDNRTLDDTLAVLLAQIAPELRRLLEARQNFRVTINGSAGHTFDVEIVKRLTF